MVLLLWKQSNTTVKSNAVELFSRITYHPLFMFAISVKKTYLRGLASACKVQMKRIRASASKCRTQNMSSGWNKLNQIGKTAVKKTAVLALLFNENKCMESVLNNATPPYQMLRPYFQEKSPVDKVSYWCGEEVKPVDRLSVWEGRGSLPYIHCGPPPTIINEPFSLLMLMSLFQCIDGERHLHDTTMTTGAHGELICQRLSKVAHSSPSF